MCAERQADGLGDLVEWFRRGASRKIDDEYLRLESPRAASPGAAEPSGKQSGVMRRARLGLTSRYSSIYSGFDLKPPP